MEVSRETTVLFAAVINGQALYDKAGDKLAHETLERAQMRLGRAAEASGARMLAAKEQKLMVLAATPDAAADAASAMLLAIEKLPKTAEVKLAAGIGFHFGPVIQKGDEVFGDPVNLAARLSEMAGAGQIITTEWTAKLLSPLYRAWVRTLEKGQLKGRSEEVGLCELVWRADDITAVVRQRPLEEKAAALPVLHLTYQGKTITRRREKESVSIGRGEDCGLVVHDEQASRHHCTIERRRDKFVLIDMSTNGTYVTIDGSPETELDREELMLSKKGWITFGQPRVHSKDVVEFTIE